MMFRNEKILWNIIFITSRLLLFRTAFFVVLAHFERRIVKCVQYAFDGTYKFGENKFPKDLTK
ncbi:hypothetical protein RASY3_15335 [Ruminococcus albus SY3]|uniref:Uncharacterized protein n=1 Tax=Ruminococcus albus SY3 TaxID=1341156 RepID=A0A011WNP2_RUMAL|nr:hypothetical protein RASY3_15335 [Ruminococcus albus SY3]